MNFTELKKSIERIEEQIHQRHSNPDEIQVGIVINKIETLGPTPLATISNISLGFDWNNGKLLIDTNTPLRETDDDEIKKIMKQYNELGRTQSQIKSLQRENEKLKKELTEKK